MLEIFHEGGAGTYPTALFGLCLVAVAIRYAIRPERRWVPLQIALALTTFFMGSASAVVGLIATTRSIDQVRDRAGVIGAIGVGESLNNLAIALSLIALASVATTIGAARLARVQRAAA